MSIFDTIWSATEEAIKLAKRPLHKNKIQRSFEAAYDKAQGEIIEKQSSIEDKRLKMKEGEYDLVGVLNLKRDIADLESLKTELKAEYLDVFGEEMKR